MEHGLEYIAFYVQKTYGTFGGLFWSPAGSRQPAGSARICETRELKGSSSHCWNTPVNMAGKTGQIQIGPFASTQ